MGVPFDVVSVTSHNDQKEIEEVKSYLGAENIYVGTGESIGIDGSRHLSGVQKDRTQVFSSPYKQEYKTVDEKISTQRKINQARSDVNIVADRLIDWYESQKQEDEK